MSKKPYPDGEMKSDRNQKLAESGKTAERLLAEGADKLTEARIVAIILRVGQGTFKKASRGETPQTLPESF